MKEAHYEWGRKQGLTDEEIEKDWQAFEADYEAWEEKRKAS